MRPRQRGSVAKDDLPFAVGDHHGRRNPGPRLFEFLQINLDRDHAQNVTAAVILRE